MTELNENIIITNNQSLSIMVTMNNHVFEDNPNQDIQNYDNDIMSPKNPVSNKKKINGIRKKKKETNEINQPSNKIENNKSTDYEKRTDYENDNDNDNENENQINNEKCKNSKKKVNEDEDITIKNYELIKTKKYKLDELRSLCLKFKLPKSGTKEILIMRLYKYFKDSVSVLKIQPIIRGFIQRSYNKLHGPAYFNRSLCLNDSDFFTMDSMNEIPEYQFYSFKDIDGFIYGFDICSLYNLIIKETPENAKNPYNRNPITIKTMQDINKLLYICTLRKLPLDVIIKTDVLDPKKKMELKILDLFQYINSLGNYSHPEWFTSLNRLQKVRFLRELIDIWDYRAQLSNIQKIQICPPVGNPFIGINYFMSYVNNYSDDNVVSYIVDIMENIVRNGLNNDSKCLGAFYILAALTLVNTDARNALPWLYESVMYNPN